jgi:ABC-2 type transport system permease protein
VLRPIVAIAIVRVEPDRAISVRDRLVNLRQVFRRIGMFFFVVFPFLLILAIGAVFGSGFTPVVGVVSRGSGPLGAELVSRLERTDGIEVRAFDDRGSVTEAVERGRVEAGLVIVEGYDDRVRSGETVALPFIARPTGGGAQVGLTVDAVIAEQSAASSGASRRGEDWVFGTRRAGPHPRRRPAGVEIRGVAEEEPIRGSYGAAGAGPVRVPRSLAASGMLIHSQVGMSGGCSLAGNERRTSSAGRSAVRDRHVPGRHLRGYAPAVRCRLGRHSEQHRVVVYSRSLGQGGVLMGSGLHADRGRRLGVFIGLGFAALGGCMVPIDLFPPAMVTIAHVTPHAWAMDAFDEVQRRGGTIVDVLPELGVLAVYAAALLAVASVVFRRKLTAPEASS